MGQGLRPLIPTHKGDEMQKIILKIVKWLMKHVDGYHLAKNGGGKKKKQINPSARA